MIVSLSFVQKFDTYREMINSVLLVSDRTVVYKKASYLLC